MLQGTLKMMRKARKPLAEYLLLFAEVRKCLPLADLWSVCALLPAIHLEITRCLMKLMALDNSRFPLLCILTNKDEWAWKAIEAEGVDSSAV